MPTDVAVIRCFEWTLADDFATRDIEFDTG
jgi:hypothetical protein